MNRLVSLVALVAVLAGAFWLSRPDQITAEEDPMAQTTPPSDETIRADADAAYADGPQSLRDLSFSIQKGETPDPLLLENIGPAALNQIYQSPATGQRHLLTDAVMTRNLGAMQALIAAGADPNIFDSFIGFHLVTSIVEVRMVPFNDYSANTPFLQAYIDGGGDIEAPEPNGTASLLGVAIGSNNLEGSLQLLDAGADLWRGAVVDGHEYNAPIKNLSTSVVEPVAAEMMFRIVVAGHFSDAAPGQVGPIADNVSSLLADTIDDPGPRGKAQSWRMQQILTAIFDNSSVSPSGQAQKLLETRIPDVDGGWFMGPNQLHVAADFPEGEITSGEIIWSDEAQQ